MDNGITWTSRKWKLVWADEFDGPEGDSFNAGKWLAEVGGSWGNQELQYYSDRIENVALDGKGNLAITARKEALPGIECHKKPCEYTSARLSTRQTIRFTYGRFETRIRVPRGQGIWPAFWLVGWPEGGEIDIMEHIGREPRSVHGTVHGPGYYGSGGIGKIHTIKRAFADDFHVFAVDWDADAIRWYIDGELYHLITPEHLHGNRWMFDHDFYINLNLAVGGAWPGNPDATTTFPQTMLIDYVRVYTLAD
ncbi:MAG TPA: glycoside hydrolase family 16 protein [Phototrophicaceae bacterium]|nr:glycoside hydrolase family 16 protein [Phototrophicaceae bacterium]